MIVRTLTWLLLLAAIGALAAWIGDHPGDLRFDWLGYRVETSVGVGIAALGSLLLLSTLLVYGLARLSHLPLRLRLDRQRTAQARSLDALTQAFVALAIGDRPQALLQARQAEKRIGAHPLAVLIRAQVAQAGGDAVAARGELETLFGYDETRMLAASHLSLLSRREGRIAEALAQAETAHRLASKNVQAAMRLLDLYLLAGRRDAAVRLLARLRHAGVKDGTAHAEALVHTLVSRECAERGDRPAVLAEARAAHRAEPGFVPACVAVVEAALEAGHLREALAALKRTWSVSPHPDLAKLFVATVAGRKEKTQQKLAAAMLRHQQTHPESLALLATLALLHGHYDDARQRWSDLCRVRPEPRFAERLAEAEEKAGYASIAVPTLPHDGAWHCGVCAAVSNAWYAHCPACGAFDALSWNGERPGEGSSLPIPLALPV